MIELRAVASGAGLSCHAIEQQICAIWSRYFGRVVRPYDDFFELGGDSISMIDVVAEARGAGLPIRSSVALRCPSPARLAEAVTIGAPATADAVRVRLPVLATPGPARHRTRAPLRSVPIQASAADRAVPLYVVHSDSHVEAERLAVAGWGGTRQVRGIEPAGLPGLAAPSATVGELAGEIRQALRSERPTGPYRLAGFGPGAVLAFEAARQLRDAGQRVDSLTLIRPPADGPGADADSLLRHRLARLADRFGLAGTETVEEIHARVRAHGWYDDGVAPADLARLQALWVALTMAVASYEPPGYDGPVTLVEDAMDTPVPGGRWARAAPDLQVHRFDHGVESPLAVLRDPRLADVMRTAVEG